MMALVSLKVTGRLLRSPVFIILIIFWLIMAISLASLSQPTSFYTSLISDNGNVPQYQTATITDLNGTNATVYSQTFNEYGDLEPGWNVSYSLSIFPDQKDIIVNSYAGITDRDGMVIYNITGLQKNQSYSVSETVTYNGNEWANHTTDILTFVTHGTPSPSVVSGQVSITPVLSEASPSHFALHIWKIPQNRKENYTVQYGVSSGNNFVQAINWMVNGNLPDQLVNFTMVSQANIQTHLNFTGEPYYYTIGVRSENGSLAGTAMFGSRVSSQAKMEDSVFLIFAGLSLFLILIFLYVSTYLSNVFRKVIKNGKMRRFIFGKGDLPYRQEISGRYGEILLTSVLLSIPFILITAFVTYLFAIRIYGISLNPEILISYSAASFMTVLFTSSLTIVVLRSRIGKFLVKNEEKNTIPSKLVTVVPSYLLSLFYLSLLTGYGLLSLLSSSQQTLQKVTLALYSINPLTYLWLLGSYFSRDIAVTGTSTFNPSALGLSPLTLLLIGLVWVIIILVIPGIIFRKRERRQTTLSD
jgi:hypothetical protein